jgi:hypothetical protein
MEISKRITEKFFYTAHINMINFDGLIAHWKVSGYTVNPDHKIKAQELFNEFSRLNYAGVESIEVCGETFMPHELTN